MKVIRAKENLWVPVDPEMPEKDQAVKLINTGKCALVPSSFKGGSFELVADLEKMKEKKVK